MTEKYDYDIGLVIHSSKNYGNNLTNYSLYTFLKKQQYRVLLIPKKKVISLFNKKVFTEINRSPLSNLNAVCHIFLLGSDQTLAKWCLGGDFFTCMPWANSNKYLATYGASFGTNTFVMDEEYHKKLRYYLSRFQYITLREESSVPMMKSVFGLSSIFVLDPVFLTSKEEYRGIADKGKFFGKRYVAAYLLDEDQDKIDLIKKVMAVSGIETNYVVYNAANNYHAQYDGINVICPNIEEFLGMIDNCEYLVTDSFHGLCFALIFNKPFYITKIKNARGLDRLESILSIVGVNDRWLQKTNNILESSDLNYEEINKKLAIHIRNSKNILNNIIEQGLRFEKKRCDYTYEYITILENKISSLYNNYAYLLSLINSVLVNKGIDCNISRLLQSNTIEEYYSNIPQGFIILSSVCGDASENWSLVNHIYHTNIGYCESYCSLIDGDNVFSDSNTEDSAQIERTVGNVDYKIVSRKYFSKSDNGYSLFLINKKQIEIKEYGLNVVVLSKTADLIIDVINISLNKKERPFIKRIYGW